ncbi:MFS general substrate transporter [Teratosphaeria nubilosa]|uniref:MFS general substrate transporter n=1 Tax=Teratosphaeria nubilosa TaxID=161662 RepID=A0A6G1L2K7_9PEZI|nr:MFS general substrate transporter [Teratosphaeria nubilosa]
MAPRRDDERRPLLLQHHPGVDHGPQEEAVQFREDDPGNPRLWPKGWKYAIVLQIFFLALVCPMASSIFAPAASAIAETFETSTQIVEIGQTAFVIMLGLGPLFLAPMSETFGRRLVFLTNLAVFTALQIPIALALNVATFVVLKTFSGLCGSVGVANGGGAISDMFETHERAMVLGFYLVAPLLGPSLRPLIGGLISDALGWRWIFWVLLMLAAVVTTVCYFFLYDTNAVILLQQRKTELEKQNKGKKYTVDGVPDQPMLKRMAKNSTRALRILTTQPIVLTMSTYQALIFSTMYSLYSEYATIFSGGSPQQPTLYHFNTTQIGFLYSGPCIGFILTAVIVVLYIDKVYTYYTEKNDDDGKPEYRLPLANIGALCLPISLFWFGWSVDQGQPWPVPWAATLLFGAAQVSIFNTCQTYYIDAFESQPRRLWRPGRA